MTNIFLVEVKTNRLERMMFSLIARMESQRVHRNEGEPMKVNIKQEDSWKFDCGGRLLSFQPKIELKEWLRRVRPARMEREDGEARF